MSAGAKERRDEIPRKEGTKDQPVSKGSSSTKERSPSDESIDRSQGVLRPPGGSLDQLKKGSRDNLFPLRQTSKNG